MIRVGPAGWSYSDWEGTVYPPHGSRFDHLAYLASFFDTIEVNSSFYRIPPPAHAHSWLRRTASNGDFRFSVKLFRRFTHERDAAPSDIDAFRRFLDPLAENGRLGALLLQFPWSFRRTPENEQRLAALFDRFRDYPRVLEVRHASFQTDDFHRFLDEQEVAVANIDQPLFSDSVRPGETVTGPIGYVRFHGRNYGKWFRHDEAWERYDYLYSAQELAPWVGRIESMAKERDVYVVTNNHFRGQAVVNAIDIEGALGLDRRIPPQLAETYPDRFGSPLPPAAENLLTEEPE